jgi:hypothetical protein
VLEGDKMTQYMIKPDDIAILLDSMAELYKESDDITPKEVATRMTSKCGRAIHYHFVAYLFTQLGFVTKNGTYARRCERFIVRDDERMASVRKESPRMAVRTIANNYDNLSPYAKITNRNTWNYFKP